MLYNNTPIGMDAWLLARSEIRTTHANAGPTAKAATRYRHWKPRDSASLDHVTQQDIDATLRTRWAERLLTAIRPYPLPFFEDNPEPSQQIRLLGKTKWTTIKTHALTVERMLRVDPGILLWKGGRTTTARTHDFLDKVVESNCKLSRLQSYWNTLKCVCQKTGYDPPTVREDLKSAYEHATTKLSTALYREPHRAHMPPDEVVQALEKGATNATRSSVYQYYASMLRTQLGVSARFVGMQHTSPCTHEVHKHHIDMAPWQDKDY